MTALQTSEIACRRGLNAVYSGAPLPRCVIPRYHDDFVPPSSNPRAHDWNSSSSSAAPTYFDTLPYDVLDNVLRQSSACPRKKDWRKFLNPEDVHKFFSGQSPLQYVAEKRLTQLLIGDDMGSISRRCAMVPHDAEVTLMEQTVDSMAKFLDRLCVRHVPTDAEFLLSVANKCRSLNRLVLKEAPPVHLLRYVLESRGHQLTHLSLCRVSADISTLIGTRCRVLRRVCILRPSGSLVALWRRVGNTLEHVRLFFAESLHESGCLKSIQLHCRKLRIVTIELSKKTVSYTAYAGLLALCGMQLSNAFLGSMPPDLCERLAAACPEARFVVDSQRALSRQIAALGSCLGSFRCRSELHPVVMAADRCLNVRMIFISSKMSCTVQIMKALFSEPKLRLETFGIGHTTGCCQEILGIVAKGTGYLKEFFCVVDIDERFSFLSLAKANPGLRTARVKVVKQGQPGTDLFPYEKAERIIVDMLMCLKVCALVREITAWALPTPEKVPSIWQHDWGSLSSTVDEGPILTSVADACCVFRGQRTYVRVFGRDYLA